MLLRWLAVGLLSALVAGAAFACAPAPPARALASPPAASLPAAAPPPAAVPAAAPALDVPAAVPASQPAVEVIGYSAGGLPLTVYWVGTGQTVVVVQGAIHGGPEANTARLVYQLRDYFQERPEEIPAGLRLAFMPEANPDGIAIDSRFYLSGVDPNRNWDTADWQADAYDGAGRLRAGLGGSAPMSEPETRAMAAWFLAVRPAVVVQYHSQGAFVVGTPELAAAYSAASGYYRPLPGHTGNVLGYRATGTLGRWLAEQGIGSVLIELSNHRDTEFARNLAGLRALLRVVAEGQAPAAE
ncbi:MAG TPA: M14 family metallopeptidase [Chloroflexota bacterium]|nr:M14 family metallopeptidase [Chloroflexota bacterium]